MYVLCICIVQLMLTKIFINDFSQYFRVQSLKWKTTLINISSCSNKIQFSFYKLLLLLNIF